MSQTTSTPSGTPLSSEVPEVLTLAEAAAYLRVAESAVIELMASHSLPGRKIGDQWRFHRLGLAEWLIQRSPKQRLLRHAGAMKNDPDRDAMLEAIYRERGRAMIA